MDWKSALAEYIRKYRWALLVLLAGLFMMCLPDGESGQTNGDIPTQKMTTGQSLQQELEEMLSELEGAGRVKVLLTTLSGAQTHYQKDTDQSKTADMQDKTSSTVIITQADRGETGLVERVDPPIYRGAVIVCQGADKPSVKLAIVDAVSKATGLTSDKISVWKMK